MAKKAVYAPAAVQDLKEAGRYTLVTWGKLQRDKYLRAIQDRVDQLTEKPYLARQYQELNGQPYGYLQGKHIIFFHIKESGIEVIRILHAARDIKSEFKE